MAKPNVLLEKSFAFGVEIIGFAQQLQAAKQYDLASQLLRAGTSIGANSEEAAAASSRRDFVHKLKIATKEARETHYWLRLLMASSVGDRNQLLRLKSSCEELKRILSSILLTCEQRYGDQIAESDADYEKHSEFGIRNSELTAFELFSGAEQ